MSVISNTNVFTYCRTQLNSDVRNEQKNQEKKKRTLEERKMWRITYHKEKWFKTWSIMSTFGRLTFCLWKYLSGKMINCHDFIPFNFRYVNPILTETESEVSKVVHFLFWHADRRLIVSLPLHDISIRRGAFCSLYCFGLKRCFTYHVEFI